MKTKKMTMTSDRTTKASKKDEDAYRSYARKVDEQDRPVAATTPAKKAAGVHLCPKCNVPLTSTEKPDYMRCQKCTWLYDRLQWK